MTSRSRSYQKDRTNNANFSIMNFALVTLFTVLSVVIAFMMYSYNFLAFRHLNLIIGAVLVILFFVFLILTVTKKAKLFTTIGLILGNLALIGMLFAFKSTIDLTGKFNKTASFSEVEMSVVVPKDSQVSSVSSLKSVDAPTDNDQTNIDTLIKQIKSETGTSLSANKVASYQEAYQNVINGQSEAMVMNSAYKSIIVQNDNDYENKVKTLYTYKIKKDIKTKDSATSKNKSGVYNLYISGIDTYGPISTVSRSDVNILMTVNMNTHKVLLTTTPRDAYVKIPDGGGNQYDKLTHAGIYGVETSMKTLENLYDVNIDNYARINFTSFMSLIDILGGVEVQNDKAFSAGGFDFPVGTISLNSKQALVFVRERHALEGGDGDRGKNQEKVVAAIINKLSAIKSPSQFSSIINNLSSSIQTDMDLGQMMTIANSQLEGKAQFTTESQDVTGTGSTGELPSYAMPGSALYMLKLDDNSLNQAKEKIKAVMEGN